MKYERIAFLQTAHPADDDRVWYHQTAALRDAGYSVDIIANHTRFIDNQHFTILENDNQPRKIRIRNYIIALHKLKPDIIVCDTPVAVFCANKYKKNNGKCKIVYDVTEWYPSKKNLLNLNFPQKILKFTVMAAASVFAAFRTDAYIFGEEHKARPFKALSPMKKSVTLPYYPDLQYITKNPNRDLSKELRIFYAGNTDKEKGFFNVLDAAKEIASRKTDTKFILNIISNDDYSDNGNRRENLEIIIEKFQPFDIFCKKAAENDIFLDLRKRDFENNRALPIKLFYYMAMGRPIIYSDLKAIRRGCPEISEFGSLVEPCDTGRIADIIAKYLDDADLYAKKAEKARFYAENKYNWNLISDDFVKFIGGL